MIGNVEEEKGEKGGVCPRWTWQTDRHLLSFTKPFSILINGWWSSPPPPSLTLPTVTPEARPLPRPTFNPIHPLTINHWQTLLFVFIKSFPKNISISINAPLPSLDVKR